MAETTRGQGADGWSIVAGLWLAVSPYVMGFAGTTIGSNTLLFGILIALVALFHMIYSESVGGLDWLNVVFGVWLIIAPFMMGPAGARATWNSVIFGIVTGSLALWASLGQTSMHTPQHGRGAQA